MYKVKCIVVDCDKRVGVKACAVYFPVGWGKFNSSHICPFICIPSSTTVRQIIAQLTMDDL